MLSWSSDRRSYGIMGTDCFQMKFTTCYRVNEGWSDRAGSLN
ncbi:hypothetical protein [Laspinema sp. D2d]|nr:hypothetical protein [Laspinema sp. D2d]